LSKTIFFAKGVPGQNTICAVLTSSNLQSTENTKSRDTDSYPKGAADMPLPLIQVISANPGRKHQEWAGIGPVVPIRPNGAWKLEALLPLILITILLFTWKLFKHSIPMIKPLQIGMAR
jgi:hypothetical protein